MVLSNWRFRCSNIKGLHLVHQTRLEIVSSLQTLNSTLLQANSVHTRCFYLLIALNVTSGLLYFLFYHPPTFRMKHRIRTKTQQAKMFDYVGAALFVGGLILFEIGFLWGGGVSSD